MNESPSAQERKTAKEKHGHLYAIVLAIAAIIYLGCMVSPPSLMDDEIVLPNQPSDSTALLPLAVESVNPQDPEAPHRTAQ